MRRDPPGRPAAGRARGRLAATSSVKVPQARLLEGPSGCVRARRRPEDARAGESGASLSKRDGRALTAWRSRTGPEVGTLVRTMVAGHTPVISQRATTTH
jgi:hypothetical protein